MERQSRKQIQKETQERDRMQAQIISDYGQATVDAAIDKWCSTCKFGTNGGRCHKLIIPLATDGNEGLCYVP